MSFAPRFEAEGSLSRGVEEAFALLDQAADLTGVEVGLRVVVRELSEGERADQETVEATIQEVCPCEAQALLGDDLRVSGETQVLGEQEPFRHVEVAVVGAGGGKVRVSFLEQQFGCRERSASPSRGGPRLPPSSYRHPLLARVPQERFFGVSVGVRAHRQQRQCVARFEGEWPCHVLRPYYLLRGVDRSAQKEQ